jgi:hypothetical protein
VKALDVNSAIASRSEHGFYAIAKTGNLKADTLRSTRHPRAAPCPIEKAPLSDRSPGPSRCFFLGAKIPN